MKILSSQLNAVTNILTINGVRPTHEQVISVTIKTLVDSGMSIQEALDAVFGENSFTAISIEIYEALRK